MTKIIIEFTDTLEGFTGHTQLLQFLAIGIIPGPWPSDFCAPVSAVPLAERLREIPRGGSLPS